MITLRATAAFGFGGKQYIGRVTGRDPKWGLRLEFIGTKGGKRNEETTAEVDDPGIYVVRNWDRKNRADETYLLILEVGQDDEGAPKLRSFSLDKSDALKIAKLMDGGRKLADIVEPIDAAPERRADRTWGYITVRQAASKAEAQTIDSATEACWQVLTALPEKQAKKVLAALRLRVSPPKTAQQLGMAADTPVGPVLDANTDAGVPAEQTGTDATPSPDATNE